MPPGTLRALGFATLAISMSSAAIGQTVCEQLIPIAAVPAAGGFAIGCASHYVLKRAGNTAIAGNYASLDYPSCPNGPCAGLTLPAKYVCEVTNGYSCCVSVADSIPLVAGVYTGPLIQSLNQRFASDTDVRTNICLSDYAGNGARLYHLPLIHSFGAGTIRVGVTGITRVFLVRPLAGNADVVVEFVDGPTPTSSATWGMTKIRYR